MPYLDANGARLHVQQLNPDCERTVILLHGLLVGSLAMWYFTAAPLLAKNFRVIMYDLRSHGRSEKRATGFDIPSMVLDLEAVIDHFQLKNFSLAGHSYGGLIALNYALSNPGRVDRLAVIEAPLPPSDMAEMKDFMKKSPGQMLYALPERLRSLAGSSKRQAVKLIQSLEYLGLKSSLFSDIQKEKDISDEKLSMLNIPTMLLYGESSSCIFAGRRMAAGISGSKFISLPGGHYLPVECAGDVKQLLTEFFCGKDKGK